MRTKCPPKFALALSAALAGFVGYIILQDGSTIATAKPPDLKSKSLVKSKPVVTSDGTLVPLFDSSTKLEPDTIEDTPQALITRVGDRGRDRHAREWMFHAYDHYLKLYWVNRTVAIEVVDTVAKGGKTVTFNMTSMVPLNGPNLRAFFEGKGTVAQYSNNMTSKTIDPLHYQAVVNTNTNDHRPLKVGDRIEIEFSPFLKPPIEGRTNYYGTAFLYVVGQPGMQPWEWHDDVETAHKNKGASLDSYPIQEVALLGGRTTVHQQYSDEPKERLKQMPTNLAPDHAQPFLLGRRLHHTDFGDGKHSEPDNPIYKEQAGKLGPLFTEHSCIACHVNNGRAMPPAVGVPLSKYAVHVGSDAKGTPHPKLGSMLQTQAVTGQPEGSIAIANWAVTKGTYGDGTAYELHKPVYKFAGPTPSFFSVRIAPPLIGQGLLEAIDESTIAALAEANKNNTDGIAGRMATVTDPETGELRMGRFDLKAGQPKLKHQIAGALKNDMGVTTTIFSKPDRGSAQPDFGAGADVKLADEDFNNLYHYIALLGVPPARNYKEADVIAGQALFIKASCSKCHVDTLKTGSYHPFPELRNQTIHPFTDLLLHDMGKDLADNMAQGNASGAEWRTPPLWGIGLTAGVSGGESYLHDGRARDLSEAILWHGGEGEKAKEAFRTMSASDRASLIKFLQAL